MPKEVSDSINLFFNNNCMRPESLTFLALPLGSPNAPDDARHRSKIAWPAAFGCKRSGMSSSSTFTK